MTPTLCLLLAALLIGVPTALAVLLWAAAAMAGKVE
jgi:hypothetical protein